MYCMPPEAALTRVRVVGVPTLTYAGESLHQRTTASALLALGLDMLIARTVLDYEAIAVKLVKNAETLTAVRLRLLCSRPLGNYSDVNPRMCVPRKMAGGWGDEDAGDEKRGGRMGLSSLWQVDRGARGLEAGLRLSHELTGMQGEGRGCGGALRQSGSASGGGDGEACMHILVVSSRSNEAALASG